FEGETMRILLGALLAAHCGAAQADFMSGNDLHQACSSNNRFVSVAGFFDKANADIAVVTPPEIQKNRDLAFVERNIHPYCVSGEVALGQLRDVACKWL